MLCEAQLQEGLGAPSKIWYNMADTRANRRADGRTESWVTDDGVLKTKEVVAGLRYTSGAMQAENRGCEL